MLALAAPVALGVPVTSRAAMVQAWAEGMVAIMAVEWMCPAEGEVEIWEGMEAVWVEVLVVLEVLAEGGRSDDR